MNFQNNAVAEPETTETAVSCSDATGYTEDTHGDASTYAEPLNEETTETTGTDIFAETEGAALPPKVPEIHRGKVVNLETGVSTNKGTPFVQINLESTDTGAPFPLTIYPPAAWFDPTCWNGSRFDLSTLSGTPAPGKQMSERSIYARTVWSEEGTKVPTKAPIAEVPEYNGNEGTLQLLAKLGKANGVTSTVAIHDAETFVEAINQYAQGLEVLFTRVVEKGDEEYGPKLKVGRIMPIQTLDQVNFDKRFPEYNAQTGKGYRRAFGR